jgi:hypothetical protein
LAERLRRFRLSPADEAVDFFWNRPTPRLQRLEQQVRQDWHFSPTILVNVSQPLAASSRDQTAPQPLMLAQTALPSPLLMRTVERQIENRVLDRTSILRQTISPLRREPPARTSPPAARPVPAPQIVVRTDAPVVRTDMVFVRTPPPPVVPNPVVSAALTHGAGPLQKSAPPSSALSPALRLERITAEVIRALDARDVARRERMGRS